MAPATRQRVLAAAQELGHRPRSVAVALAQRRRNVLGLVFPDLSGPYYPEVILGFEEQARSRQQSVMMVGTHGAAHVGKLVADLADRMDGLAIWGRTIDDEEIAPAVRTESFTSEVELTLHLLQVHGHGQIAFLGDPDGALDVAGRWQGFREAFRQAGLEPSPRRRQSVFAASSRQTDARGRCSSCRASCGRLPSSAPQRNGLWCPRCGGGPGHQDSGAVGGHRLGR